MEAGIRPVTARLPLDGASRPGGSCERSDDCPMEQGTWAVGKSADPIKFLRSRISSPLLPNGMIDPGESFTRYCHLQRVQV